MCGPMEGRVDQRLSFVCGEGLAQQVDSLAREYGLSRQEVLRQLVQTGLEEVER